MADYCPGTLTGHWLAKLMKPVLVYFVVAPNGSVANVKLLRRSTPDFNDFAVSVVSKWKFRPATKDGTPVARAP